MAIKHSNLTHTICQPFYFKHLITTVKHAAGCGIHDVDGSLLWHILRDVVFVFLMQASTSSISTLHRVETSVSLSGAKSNSRTGFQPEEYEFAAAEAAASHDDDSWLLSRFFETFASKHPGWYGRAIRTMTYWRGPRPKVELPGL